MNHHDVDPSLCAAEPLLESLADGFSPPAETHPQPTQANGESTEPPENALSPKSPF